MEKKKKSKADKVILTIVLLILIGAAAFGVYWFVDNSNYVAADNAKVSADILNVSPKVAGKVAEVKATQGAKVKKGDVLFTLESDQIQIQLNQAQAALEAAKGQLAKAAGGARAQEVAGAQAMVDQAQAALSGAKTGKTNLQNSLNDAQKKYNDLVAQLDNFKNPSTGTPDAGYAIGLLDAAKAKGALSDAQYTAKAEAINQLFSAKSQLEAQISQLKGQISSTDSQISASKANVDAANSKLSLTNAGASDKDIAILEQQVKVSQANYDLVKLNLDNTQVKAPIDGTVVQVNVLVGDNASPSIGAVSIVDMSKIQISGEVAEKDISKVKEGQTVKLSLDAFKGISFDGKVKQIGLTTSSALNTSGISLSTSSKTNQVIPVKFDLDAQGKDIKPGMSVTAKIAVK
ncbi:HlyD family secretion protein [Clostridium sp. YIM B02515]|uniref:HlyD family secretion protein n=1 Tax=Clostridium rhizosphaerae TaxID=2803861 RepID=A0ABS1TBK8_9CLOT|nr:efflux RND transporter periplasmic adaptor subunit [Clostridium rhizosphaerae]MBL4936749.1 HlyD family secretion protein [Clostridium rhizosphaerae]